MDGFGAESDDLGPPPPQGQYQQHQNARPMDSPLDIADCLHMISDQEQQPAPPLQARVVEGVRQLTPLEAANSSWEEEGPSCHMIRPYRG